jgi:hypothetical protein
MSIFPSRDFKTLSKAVLYTVAYADVFEYPLTAGEIHRYLTGVRASQEAVELFLHESELLSNIEGYYTLSGREGLALTRRRRDQIALNLWPQAIRYGRLIARLPFVRMLAVTGSLAMNNVEENPDIDYLIVTAAGRLWMCRAFVLAVVRLAALRGTRLCPNYLVSERALVFPDQTLYTAHELAQMVPLYGIDVYARICHQNLWLNRFLPNWGGLLSVKIGNTGLGMHGMQSILEAILLTPPGAWFEQWEMDRKIRKLACEQRESEESNFSADYCKGHLHRHGQRTELIFRQRLKSLSLEWTL